MEKEWREGLLQVMKFQHTLHHSDLLKQTCLLTRTVDGAVQQMPCTTFDVLHDPEFIRYFKQRHAHSPNTDKREKDHCNFCICCFDINEQCCSGDTSLTPIRIWRYGQTCSFVVKKRRLVHRWCSGSDHPGQLQGCAWFITGLHRPILPDHIPFYLGTSGAGNSDLILPTTR